jgi:hypothetical protein
VDPPEAPACAEPRCAEELARRAERAAFQATLAAALQERRRKPAATHEDQALPAPEIAEPSAPIPSIPSEAEALRLERAEREAAITVSLRERRRPRKEAAPREEPAPEEKPRAREEKPRARKWNGWTWK